MAKAIRIPVAPRRRELHKSSLFCCDFVVHSRRHFVVCFCIATDARVQAPTITRNTKSLRHSYASQNQERSCRHRIAHLILVEPTIVYLLLGQTLRYEESALWLKPFESRWHHS